MRWCVCPDGPQRGAVIVVCTSDSPNSTVLRGETPNPYRPGPIAPGAEVNRQRWAEHVMPVLDGVLDPLGDGLGRAA